MAQLTITKRAGITIPAALRKKYKLYAGTRVRIIDQDGVLAIVPVPEDSVNQARGILPGESSLTKALLAERAKDRHKENHSPFATHF